MERLVGFVNVAWDGGHHAFLLDTKTHDDWQPHGVPWVTLAVAQVPAHDQARERARTRSPEPARSRRRRTGAHGEPDRVARVPRRQHRRGIRVGLHRRRARSGGRDHRVRARAGERDAAPGTCRSRRARYDTPRPRTRGAGCLRELRSRYQPRAPRSAPDHIVLRRLRVLNRPARAVKRHESTAREDRAIGTSAFSALRSATSMQALAIIYAEEQYS